MPSLQTPAAGLGVPSPPTALTNWPQMGGGFPPQFWWLTSMTHRTQGSTVLQSQFYDDTNQEQPNEDTQREVWKGPKLEASVLRTHSLLAHWCVSPAREFTCAPVSGVLIRVSLYSRRPLMESLSTWLISVPRPSPTPILPQRSGPRAQPSHHKVALSGVGSSHSELRNSPGTHGITQTRLSLRKFPAFRGYFSGTLDKEQINSLLYSTSLPII